MGRVQHFCLMEKLRDDGQFAKARIIQIWMQSNDLADFRGDIYFHGHGGREC